MVPGEGCKSNSKGALLAEWEANNKGVGAEDWEAVFETLAEWNEYLENHVPYFREVQP